MIQEEYWFGEVPGEQSTKKKQSTVIPCLRPTDVSEQGEEERAEVLISENWKEECEETCIPEAHLDIQGASHIGRFAGEEF